jgi:hypothetical protein
MSKVRSLAMFSDPWNPSSAEVRAWAYTPGAIEPCQDWDLSLSWAGHERDYLKFAGDSACPNSDYFLRVLYLMVGDAVRNGYRTVPEPIVLGFVDLADGSPDQRIRLWRTRALRLLKHPEEFQYEAWCGGRLAREQLPNPSIERTSQRQLRALCAAARVKR